MKKLSTFSPFFIFSLISVELNFIGFIFFIFIIDSLFFLNSSSLSIISSKLSPSLSSTILSENGKILISVDVTNTGNYDADEIVQLYIRDLVGSVSRPVKELKGFERICLKKGETKTVTFTLTPDDLKFYNQELEYKYEPGEFEVMVGPNSKNVQTLKFELK